MAPKLDTSSSRLRRSGGSLLTRLASCCLGKPDITIIESFISDVKPSAARYQSLASTTSPYGTPTPRVVLFPETFQPSRLSAASLVEGRCGLHCTHHRAGKPSATRTPAIPVRRDPEGGSPTLCQHDECGCVTGRMPGDAATGQPVDGPSALGMLLGWVWMMTLKRESGRGTQVVADPISAEKLYHEQRPAE